MSPRPYRLGQRQAAADQTRARILAAARDLLAADGGVGGFTIDAVAREAGVARMTVYYQFSSKRGLLEALFTHLAVRGGLHNLADAFHHPQPRGALAAFIVAFVRFWASDRLVLRRLHALAVLDPDVEQESRTRQEWRRGGARVILGRLAEQYGRPTPETFDEATDVLYTLTSFETFDALAGSTRDPDQVAALVLRLVLVVLGVQEARPEPAE